jgi:histidinol-phosphate aminotransferase
MSHKEQLAGASRRAFLQTSAGVTAALAFRIVGEATLAAAQRETFPVGAIRINANENPLGPCEAARKAVADIAAEGGRYNMWLNDELAKDYAKSLGVPREYVAAFPGSSEPLHFAVLAFASATRSYVTADPGYEAGMHAAQYAGARIVKTPLTKTYAHDVAAMLGAAPDAGIFYVCTPNNPTGTVTPHADIEQLVAQKPKGAVVLVDEAYIHFSDTTSAIDLVKAGRDVIVLRTFSKIYGMAGLRCGMAIARPELLEKLTRYGGWGAMPITALAAATASLKESQLVAERKRINTSNRQKTFEWLDRQGYAYVPSESNCFMLDTKRPTKEVIDSMAARNVLIGRAWPAWPTHVRITVGTLAEMEEFQTAFHQVMTGAKTVGYAPSLEKSWFCSDGQSWPVG